MAETVHPLVLRAREAFARSEIKSAEQAVEERLRTAGRDINALEVRYQIQKHRGQLGEAARTLDTVIGINSRADWAYNELVKLLMTHGKTADAEQVSRAALRANPNNAEAHNLFGVIISDNGDLQAGEWHFRRALEIAEPPGHGPSARPASLRNLGDNLVKQGHLDEANNCFERAHELAPNDAKTLCSWSKLCEARGDLSRAGELIERAATLSSPEEVALLRANYQVQTGKPEEALATLNSAKTLSGEGQLARGHVHERLGRYEEAWQDFLAGKRKLASDAGGLVYKADAVEALFGRFKEFFTRDNMARMPRARQRPDVPQPIFIMGLPCSGTAMVDKILRSHSSVRTGGELAFLGELRKVATDVLPAAPQSFPENLAQSWTADRHFTATLFRDYYFARAEGYGLLNGHGSSGRGFFTDRTPSNEIYLPLLKMAFPQARIVHVIRHPLDVCLSMISSNMKLGFNCGYRMEDAAHYLGAVFDLYEHYRRELALGDYVIQYEALVADPGGQTRRLLDYLGLPFEDRQLHGVLGDGSIDRHRHYAQQLKPYMSRLRPVMAAQGYAPKES
jgi:tetratricopeptide (TPR) repeat protein